MLLDTIVKSTLLHSGRDQSRVNAKTPIPRPSLINGTARKDLKPMSINLTAAEALGPAAWLYYTRLDRTSDFKAHGHRPGSSMTLHRGSGADQRLAR
jgi:hypothetical protein